MSEAAVFPTLRSLSEPLSGTVEEDESDEGSVASTAGECDDEVLALEGKTWQTAWVMEGDKGVISCFSLIETTILSNFTEVICFSRPLLDPRLASACRSRGALMSIGAVCDESFVAASASSSDDTESTLVDRVGSSRVADREEFGWMGGVVARCG